MANKDKKVHMILFWHIYNATQLIEAKANYIGSFFTHFKIFDRNYPKLRPGSERGFTHSIQLMTLAVSAFVDMCSLYMCQFALYRLQCELLDCHVFSIALFAITPP